LAQAAPPRARAMRRCAGSRQAVQHHAQEHPQPPGSPPPAPRRRRGESSGTSTPVLPAPRGGAGAPSLPPSGGVRSSASLSARGVSRAKLCVCGASSQLGRERSRLLKADRAVRERLQRLAEREEALDTLDAKIFAQEEDLCERREDQRCEEVDVSRRLEALVLEVQAAERRHEASLLHQGRLEERRLEVLRLQQRAQKRLERTEASQRQLAQDRRDVEELRAEREDESLAIAGAEPLAARGASMVSKWREQLARLEADAGERRLAVRMRQEELEPIQSDLQAKEAELNERQALVERRRTALAAREEQLESSLAESGAADERCAAARRSNRETEARLARLWDDIHQRQQVLDDLDASLRGREARLDAAELRSLAGRGARGEAARAVGPAVGGGSAVGGGLREAWPPPEAEQLELELRAAEISDRAWRKQSVALARSEEELLARVRQLEAGLASAPAVG